MRFLEDSVVKLNFEEFWFLCVVRLSTSEHWIFRAEKKKNFISGSVSVDR
jgi:hypothetical protein